MWVRRLSPLPKLAPVFVRRYHRSPVPLLDDLAERGFIQDVSRRDALAIALSSKKQTVYVGVDPTAKALHIGHLVPLLCLLHFQFHGHRILPLIGGATGRVGDPSGRLVERQLAHASEVEANAVNLTSSIQRFFQNALLYAASRSESQDGVFQEPHILNNLDWHGSTGLLQFLQTVGVHARVGTMLNRESVRSRLSSQQGLSFTEFTYQLLQAYDFYHLYKHFGCTIQIGGSDQWGNIVAGLELIGKFQPDFSSNDSFGITTPLLTTSTGEKFGKSAGNAVWLDPQLTSVFDFYQYFLKVTDADVEKYLKLFTFMPLSEISDVMQQHREFPENRIAQHHLAAEVTEMVHSKSGVARANLMTTLLFGSDYSELKAEDVTTSLGNDPRLVRVAKSDILSMPIPKLAAKYGLVASNSASKMLVASRGLYLNNRSVTDVQYKASPEDLLDGNFLIIRAGKDKMMVLVVSDEDI
ncbi:Tyrosine--tRNA ligase, mitochondrial [Psilocybe cubensis]|uniref:Tyrosine--tRNA ligase, mitochondrial n=2 Tax=Psilocybe cubensis TaxID=181762 RepID=A0ACB8HCJ8_PSICU|nr:Tyrosine--tRNA ligase, mitochondrial [Psilocybe cubensis]KAH9485414.1 Tyrosine--tRNA ligase, mitochondrial [Psilocybe cubensis]